jgi:hypothetical protein
MSALRRFLRRLTSWAATSAQDETRVRSEIEQHIAMQTADNLRAGLSPVEARREALVKFGSVEAVKDSCRDQQGLPWLADLARDLRHGTRTLAREKGFTAAAVIVLAMGVGANAGIFTLVDQVLLRPLPVQEPGRHDARPAGAKPGPYRMAIVNETFARRYFGNRSPVGARVGPGNSPNTRTEVEIVGVVREISRVDMRDRDVDQIFYNFWDNQSENGTFYVRVRNPGDAAAAIAAIVADVDPQLPLNSMTTLDAQIDRALFNERALAVLSTGFGALATLIAIVGLYGVMAFVAAQRRQEIGLRIALGATRADAVWLVVRDATLMVGAGVVVALPAVWMLSRLVEAQLFGVAAFDWPTLATAAFGLALMALSAALLPAWRASRLDPNAILKATVLLIALLRNPI